MPITVPGTAKLNMLTDSTKRLPGNLTRMTRYAITMPKSPAKGVAVPAIMSVSRTALNPTPNTNLKWSRVGL